MTRKVLLRLETLWEKGEIARYEKISFSHGGFRRFELHVKKNQGLFGKGLTDPLIHDIAVIGIFNEKRSHGMAVGDASVFPGFLTPVRHNNISKAPDYFSVMPQK